MPKSYFFRNKTFFVFQDRRLTNLIYIKTMPRQEKRQIESTIPCMRPFPFLSFSFCRTFLACQKQNRSTFNHIYFKKGSDRKKKTNRIYYSLHETLPLFCLFLFAAHFWHARHKIAVHSIYVFHSSTYFAVL